MLCCLFQRCNAVAEQRDVLVSYMAGKAQTPGQVRSQTGQLLALFIAQCLLPEICQVEVWKIKTTFSGESNV